MAEPIIRFRVDREVIQAGESATVRWHVENVKAVFFSPRESGGESMVW